MNCKNCGHELYGKDYFGKWQHLIKENYKEDSYDMAIKCGCNCTKPEPKQSQVVRKE